MSTYLNDKRNTQWTTVLRGLSGVVEGPYTHKQIQGLAVTARALWENERHYYLSSLGESYEVVFYTGNVEPGGLRVHGEIVDPCCLRWYAIDEGLIDALEAAAAEGKDFYIC